MNPKCLNLIEHTMVTRWHENGSNPGGKERYNKHCNKLTPKVNYAAVNVPGENIQNADPPDETMNMSMFKCSETTEMNKDIFYLYPAGNYKTILPYTNTLMDMYNSDPKAFFAAIHIFKALAPHIIL